MIAPLLPYGVRGAIWYQGESNVSRAYQYRTLFPVMIRDWRAAFARPDMPFGFVQIAPFRYGGQDPANCAELWEAQLLTLKNVPNTGMVVTTDIGNIQDIHPKNKQDVCKRLGLWARATVYGQKDLVYSGPIYKSMAVEGNKIRLTFDHVGSGLITRDGKAPTDFTIAGADQKFLPAIAAIDGNTVVVSNDEIKEPAAVRFAWYDTAMPNLCNKESLPASPFRTDQWKGLTEGNN
jgi:sialate O-acetylesterase